jgi:carbonic anhydrase
MQETFVELLAANLEHAGEVGSRFDDLQEGQHPHTVTICCSDSRVLQDHMWSNDDPGRIFTCGNIGNRVVQRAADGDVVSGDVLYPLAHTGTETAVVVGHTGCGAVTATYEALTDGVSDLPGIEHCLDLLKPHVAPGIEALPADLNRAEAINHLVEYNVDRQVELLVESDDVPDGVEVIGAVYDFQDIYGGDRGEIHVINVDGEERVTALREANPAIAERVDRLWERE